MKHLHCKTKDYPIGRIAVFASDGAITEIRIENEISDDSDAVIDDALKQLDEYFCGKRKVFDLNIKYLQGTDFQHKVWDALRVIPYGETVTYGQLAEIVGCPKGARAIGNAVHNNPVLIVNPCHRVVAAKGKIGGFSYGIAMKKELLELEEKYK